MNPQLLLKILPLLRKNSKNQGFTLIELLVVVIILGVLVAIALPNYLAQIGKGREAEFKNAIGTINRAQQAYHWEFTIFADSTTTLQVRVDPGKYMDQVVISSPANSNSTTVITKNPEAVTDATRAYSGGTAYSNGAYTTIVCQTDEPTTDGVTPNTTLPLSCGSGSTSLR
jgi:type IV pilus assembly protein PilA